MAELLDLPIMPSCDEPELKAILSPLPELENKVLLSTFESEFSYAMKTLNSTWIKRIKIDELLPSLAAAVRCGLAQEIISFLVNLPFPPKNTVNGLVGTIPFRRAEMGIGPVETNSALFHGLKLGVLEYIADQPLPPIPSE